MGRRMRSRRHAEGGPDGDGGGAAGVESASRAGAIPGMVASPIRLVVLDVDGVLTDAGVYIGATADGTTMELKRFDIQDGLGIQLLQAAGIEVVLLSGRTSEATRVRAQELNISECIQLSGGRGKLATLEGLLRDRGLGWEAVAMLGDDLPDLPVLRKAGLPAAVGNAVTEVRKEALFVTRRDGGRGAVREFARLLLKARGEWEERVEAYLGGSDDA
jgi:3-deoxy-D-manno-octulosonate 8-phosphate phosphatase (KDO 8-P phosphatase)